MIACEKKYKDLSEELKKYERVLVAFSGGVDSTFLLKACIDAIGVENVLAVTARSETYPLREFKGAERLALELGAKWKVVNSSELDIPGFSKNPHDRCYHCKKELFSILKDIATKENFDAVFDGSNASDSDDYRPGSKSADELGVISPLKKANLKKQDIRDLSKEMGVSTWNKGSFACLASRFPYGEEICIEKLNMVEKAEDFMFDLGLKQFRVRHHQGNIARLETVPEDINIVMEKREEIVTMLKKIGYVYISLDMEGYRTGSMNKTLTETELGSSL